MEVAYVHRTGGNEYLRDNAGQEAAEQDGGPRVASHLLILFPANLGVDHTNTVPEDIREQKHKHEQRDLAVRADRVDVAVQLLRLDVPPLARQELGDERFGNAQLPEEPEDAQQQRHPQPWLHPRGTVINSPRASPAFRVGM
uniref:Uncharacterized protein n=1 Tax=Anopheles merus TaxID=30066 RepID=A0A182UM89_ANOME